MRGASVLSHTPRTGTNTLQQNMSGQSWLVFISFLSYFPNLICTLMHGIMSCHVEIKREE